MCENHSVREVFPCQAIVCICTSGDIDSVWLSPLNPKCSSVKRRSRRPPARARVRAHVFIGKGNASVCTFPAQISFSVWIHQIEINTLSMSRTPSIRGKSLSRSWMHFCVCGARVCVCVRTHALRPLPKTYG